MLQAGLPENPREPCSELDTSPQETYFLPLCLQGQKEPEFIQEVLNLFRESEPPVNFN